MTFIFHAGTLNTKKYKEQEPSLSKAEDGFSCSLRGFTFSTGEWSIPEQMEYNYVKVKRKCIISSSMNPFTPKPA